MSDQDLDVFAAFEDSYERSILLDVLGCYEHHSSHLNCDETKPQSSDVCIDRSFSLPRFKYPKFEPPSWPAKQQRLLELLRRPLPEPLSDDEILDIQETFLASVSYSFVPSQRVLLQNRASADTSLPVIRRIFHVPSFFSCLTQI